MRQLAAAPVPSGASPGRSDAPALASRRRSAGPPHRPGYSRTPRARVASRNLAAARRQQHGRTPSHAARRRRRGRRRSAAAGHTATRENCWLRARWRPRQSRRCLLAPTGGGARRRPSLSGSGGGLPTSTARSWRGGAPARRGRPAISTGHTGRRTFRSDADDE